MTTSILRSAFENVIVHICNIDTMKALVNDFDEIDDSFESLISMLEKKSEDAEATLRTDIRILINECRHLKSKMTD